MIKKGILNIGLSSLAVVLGLIIYHNIYDSNNNQNFQVVKELPKVQFANHPTASNDLNFVEAAERSVNSVVHIQTITRRSGGYAYDPLRDFFFGNPYQKLPDQKVSGSGSGVIISENGYIVTNNHVINNANEIKVTLNNKMTYKADLIGTDPTTDLALIKIEEEELQPVFYGNSDELRLGEWVLAVGNPFNLTSTITAGIVSAKGRDINILKEEYAIESFIQTDAAVNPGNSGGALVNTKGELVGINTAIASNTGSYTGYSFAVPVNIVKKVTSDLMNYGMVQRGLLGVKISEINKEKAEELDYNSLNGVLIVEVNDKSAADVAGIKAGDIIVKVGAVSVSSPAHLQEQVSKFRPGDEVKLTLFKKGKLVNKTVILKNLEGTTDIIEKEELVLGAKFEALTEESLKELNIDFGVEVIKLKSGKLMREGVQKGFVITHVNHQPIKTVNELENILLSAKGGVLIEGVFPNGSRGYYGFGV